MTFHASDAWWWHFLFLFLAGAVPTDAWRLLGVHFGGRIDHRSEALVLVRCVATALVAAVIGNLVVFPSGALADVPLWMRMGAAVAGFVAYLFSRRMLIGIAVAEVLLVLGMVVS